MIRIPATVERRRRPSAPPPPKVLVAAAPGADLLVVGSRGHVALPGRLLGSVSEHVAARASCRGVVVRHLPDPITLGQRTHVSGREALSGAGFR